jgi:hypothetical protein
MPRLQVALDQGLEAVDVVVFGDDPKGLGQFLQGLFLVAEKLEQAKACVVRTGG